MTARRTRVCLGALLGGLLSLPVAADSAAGPAAGMGLAARAWLAALDPERRSAAAIDFDSEERFNWGFVPRARRGVALRDMSPEERRAARALLEASLSPRGLAKVDAIVGLEKVLFALEGREVRDPERYHVTVFGSPAAEGMWGWRFEGHHVSLNWTLVDGQVVGSTPQFLGADPAEVRDGPSQGARALAGEEDLARALVVSLSPEQRRRAIVDGQAPPDILSGTARRAARQPDVGVAADELTPEQQEMMRALLREYASAQQPAVEKARLARIGDGLTGVRFAWMGGLAKGQGHYYRIQGPSFLIEYDNTQDQANHIHSVWRELEGDWGPDPLAEHYAEAPHHAAARRAAKEIR